MKAGKILGVIGLVVAVLGFIFGGGLAGLLSFIGSTLSTVLAMLAVLAVPAAILYGIWRLVYWIGEKIVETFQWLWHCSVAGVSWCGTRMETACRAVQSRFSR